MPILFFLFIAQFVLLFLLARSFAKNLYLFWLLVTTSKSLALWLTALITLPGTIIHELSHWLTAELVGIPTGKFSFVPEVTEGGQIKMASVEIGLTDPFRRTLVGIAPVVIGITMMLLGAHFLPDNLLVHFSFLPDFFILLWLFMIANTMFSSSKDLEAAFVPSLLLGLGVFAFWFLHLSLPLIVDQWFTVLLPKLTSLFFLIIIIDVAVIIVVKLLAYFSGRILKRKIIVRRS